ncbi:MAG: helix-turn-helix transcriptional regulator [Betaproteobacteria bacterium]|nr:helix-turn-helix transcriptional regulator [Betaproteobacteria bacterium]
MTQRRPPAPKMGPDAGPDAGASLIAQATALERQGKPRDALRLLAPWLPPETRVAAPSGAWVDAALVASDCHFLMADYAASEREVARAEALARQVARPDALALADVHRARIRFQQGRYSEGLALAARAHAAAVDCGSHLVAARARMCESYLAHASGDEARAERVIADGIAQAARSGDLYWQVQLLNMAGIETLHGALRPVLPNRAIPHMTLIEPADLTGMRDRLDQALAYFDQAIALSDHRAGMRIDGILHLGRMRVMILRGEARSSLTPLAKMLKHAQVNGVRDHELAIRQAYAWALRLCGQHRESLHQLDAAIELARQQGRYLATVDLLHYNRSLTLAKMNDIAGAKASYRRYLHARKSLELSFSAAPGARASAPLEPFYMKRAERYLEQNCLRHVSLHELAGHCGVSVRTLQTAFQRYRGISPMARARHLRLDAARDALALGASVREAAAQHGFRSVTTFSMEYQRRFGQAPSQTRRRARTGPDDPAR